jgi:hypothetical protein
MATDKQIRGVVIKRLYERRNDNHGTPVMLQISEFPDYGYVELQRICRQLEEQNLIDWTPMMSGGGENVGHARLTASGIDIAEGNREPPIAITLDQSVNVHNSQNVAIGNDNTQHWQGQFEALIKQIDASTSSPAEKQQAKSILKALLSNPIVAAIAGASVGALLKQLL